MVGRAAVLACWIGLAAMAGCAPRPIGPPPAAPSLLAPADAIPGDLDVAVRVDLRRIRGALGEQVVEQLRRRAGDTVGSEDVDASVFNRAMEEADTLWVAFRPGLVPELTDSVMVFEGRFAQFDPRHDGGGDDWGAPEDLGGGWLRFSRRGKVPRAAPARVYVRAPDLVVLVSVAELDSAARAIEERAGDGHVEPASKGAISLEARAPAVARVIAETSPAAARLLARGRRVRAYGDVGAEGLKAELEVEFREESTAEDAAEAVRAVVGALATSKTLAGLVARGIRVSVVGTVVVLRLSLDAEGLQMLLEGEQGAADQPGRGDPQTR